MQQILEILGEITYLTNHEIGEKFIPNYSHIIQFLKKMTTFQQASLEPNAMLIAETNIHVAVNAILDGLQKILADMQQKQESHPSNQILFSVNDRLQLKNKIMQLKKDFPKCIIETTPFEALIHFNMVFQQTVFRIMNAYADLSITKEEKIKLVRKSMEDAFNAMIDTQLTEVLKTEDHKKYRIENYDAFSDGFRAGLWLDDSKRLNYSEQAYEAYRDGFDVAMGLDFEKEANFDEPADARILAMAEDEEQLNRAYLATKKYPYMHGKMEAEAKRLKKKELLSPIDAGNIKSIEYLVNEAKQNEALYATAADHLKELPRTIRFRLGEYIHPSLANSVQLAMKHSTAFRKARTQSEFVDEQGIPITSHTQVPIQDLPAKVESDLVEAYNQSQPAFQKAFASWVKTMDVCRQDLYATASETAFLRMQTILTAIKQAFKTLNLVKFTLRKKTSHKLIQCSYDCKEHRRIGLIVMNDKSHLTAQAEPARKLRERKMISFFRPKDEKEITPSEEKNRMNAESASLSP